MPLALVGCALAECPPGDTGASVITAQRVGGVGNGLVQGYVIGMNHSAVGTARVRLRERDSSWTSMDAAGNFQLRTTGRGSYTLEVIAEGYSSATQSVSVTPDSGIRAVATMVVLRAERRDPRCGIDSVAGRTP